MRGILRKYAVFCVFFLFIYPAHSQDINFKNYNIRDGLSDNSVSNIIQDKQGYLWFATLDGLSRFDGKFFRNFISVPGDTTSLSNSRIRKIKEDQAGYIWSWSEDGSVQRVDPVHNKVLNLQKQILQKKIGIKDFIIAPDGDIWLWGNQGAVRINYINRKRDIKAEIYNKENNFPVNEINFVFEDKESAVWMGTNQGLIKLVFNEDKDKIINVFYSDREFISYYQTRNQLFFGSKSHGILNYKLSTHNFSVYHNLNKQIHDQHICCISKPDTQTLFIGTENHIFKYDISGDVSECLSHPEFQNTTRIYTDRYKNTWIIPRSKGIFRYEERENRLKHYPLRAEERLFLGDPDQQILFEDSRDNFWIGIHGGGLFLYNREKDSFSNYRYNAEKSTSLSSDVILSLFEDYSANLWIGTMYGGVNKINLSKEKFIWHQPVSNPKNTFENEIRTLAQDKKGRLWAGSKGGKIFCYNNYRLIRTFPDDLSPENINTLHNINVYCLFFDKNDNLWIGTKGKGIYIIKDIYNNNQNKEILHFDINLSKALEGVFSIQQDKYGSFWIGSYGSGIARLIHPFTSPQFISYNHSDSPGKLVSDLIRYLFFDKKENLWIGTSAGISILPENQLRQKDKSFISITSDKSDLSTLSYNNIDHIFQASDNRIYVATMGGGFNILKRFSFADSFFEWQYFNKSNGLSSNKISAIQEDTDGNIWISSSLGINKYDPVNNKIENFFVEKDLKLNFFSEGCGILTQDGDIVFGHKRGFLSFNPDNIIKDSTGYAIVLSGFYVNGVSVLPGKKSILKKSIEFIKSVDLAYYENSLRFDFSVLDYSNPEKIQFTYKLENYDKEWSTPLTENTAIYQNLPAGEYIFLLKATNSDGIEIDDINKLKINISPSFFNSTLGYFLIGMALLSFIVLFLYLYKRQIAARQEVVYVDKLNEKKLKYYTNISHEFKTPLSLILSPVQDIIEDDDSTGEIKENAEQIKRNASYLLNLVEQILDFRKIKEEKMTLKVSRMNISHSIQKIYHQFEPLAVKQNIDLIFTSDNPELTGYIDIKVLTKILYNLLSNAFKFTPEYKSIEVGLTEEKKEGIIRIWVKDEGKGIKKSEQERLFERFARSENSSGIGLFFVKELVIKHKGSISFTSEPGKGTSFTIILPVSDKHYSKEEKSDELTLKEKSLSGFFPSGKEIQNKEKKTREHTRSILIVEDNDEMRIYLTKKFKDSYNVYSAPNGKAGVDIALKEIPDLIICDVMMPVMDGLETLRILRKNFNTSHIPIILLTANSSEEKRVEGLETGADDYITKPFNFKYLKLKIDNLISQRKKLFTNFGKEPELPANILTQSDNDKEFIEKTKKLIEDHIDKPDFNVDYLSAKVGCSRTGFYKKIKGITGETPHSFISTIQMKKAALLLKETNYSIPEISALVGFNDTNYFSKNFKKHFGITPKTYQVRIKKGNKDS